MAKTITYISEQQDLDRALVVVFLRGGADGLSLVAPVSDEDYYRVRPRVALAAKEAVRLDEIFGLAPELGALEESYQAGEMAVVHAVGSEDASRSHFEAQDFMEHGGEVAGGWLGRFLRYRSIGEVGPLSAVALGKTLPECLRGAPASTVMESINDFSLGKGGPEWMDGLEGLYGEDEGDLGLAGKNTLRALRRLDQIRADTSGPSNGAKYGTDSFSSKLQEVARLIKGKVGLQAATLDLGGWDSHLTQGTLLGPLMRYLAGGLAAFRTDLGKAMERTTIVVMTEFGRRVYENSALGTDHGRGSAMFLMGGGVEGGQVYARWLGLKEEVLEGPGDLPVTTNYRDVLASALAFHGAVPEDMGRIFPDYAVQVIPELMRGSV